MGEIIRGNRTDLRPATDADLDLLVSWFQDAEVYRWWDGEPLSRETVAAKYTGARWPTVESFIIQEDAHPAGYIQYWVADETSGGLDMFLVPSARGRGLGPDAARALTQHLFARGWRRVTVDPRLSNVAAIRAWRRAGFRAERELYDTPGGPTLLLAAHAG
jgi:aminoglycoside 6'-N-acetyltransferase